MADIPPLLCAHCLTGECVHEPRRKHTVAAAVICHGSSTCADCARADDDISPADELT